MSPVSRLGSLLLIGLSLAVPSRACAQQVEDRVLLGAHLASASYWQAWEGDRPSSSTRKGQGLDIAPGIGVSVGFPVGELGLAGADLAADLSRRVRGDSSDPTHIVDVSLQPFFDFFIPVPDWWQRVRPFVGLFAGPELGRAKTDDRVSRFVGGTFGLRAGARIFVSERISLDPLLRVSGTLGSMGDDGEEESFRSLSVGALLLLSAWLGGERVPKSCSQSSGTPP